MGAWGTGPFDNDDAAAFEAELTTHGRNAIASALRGVSQKRTQDETWCSVAIAAAEVIAAAGGHPLRSFASVAADAQAWLGETGYRPSAGQAEKAAAVVTAIGKDSALADLWRESGSLAAWRSSLKSLANRLSKPPVTGARTKPQPSPVTSKAEPRSPDRNTAKPAPIPHRTAKQILVKKAEGMLYEHRHDSFDVAVGQLKKLTRADAAALATLAEVREVDLSRLNLATDKQAFLATLLDGWSNATAITASDTKNVARFLCPRLRDGFPRLEALDLSGSDTKDNDLQQLAGHRALRQLQMSTTQVTDAVFNVVQTLPCLERVSLNDCPGVTIAAARRFSVADAGSEGDRLQFIPHPRQLGLTTPTPARQKACAARNRPVADLVYREWNIWVTLLYGNLGFGELPDLDRLSVMATQCLVDSIEIGLNDSPIRQEAADRLRGVLTAWPGIRSLSITNAKTFDDAMAAEIARLTKLESLEIHAAAIGDTMAKAIATLKPLRRLQLTQTRITTKGLAHVAALPQLRWLALSPSPTLPRKAILAVRRRLAPRCYVGCDEHPGNAVSA